MFDLSNDKAVSDRPDRATLVPRIKTLQFTAFFQERNIPADQIPYTESLVADLLINYAFDLPFGFQMASLAAIAAAGIRAEEVRSVAIANLKRQLPEIGISDHGLFRQIVTGENLEACTLLAESFWDAISSETQGEIVVAVPSRDVVLYCSSHSAEGIDALRTLAAQVLQNETTHGLTGRLLVWHNSQWELFYAQPPKPLPLEFDL